MEVLLVLMLFVVACMLGYIIYKMNHETPEQVENKEKKELIKRESKHYSKLMNFSAEKAYGGE